MTAIDCVRYEYSYRGRNIYVVVSEKEVICSVPPGDSYLNSVLTSLTRMVSISLQHGIPREIVKKQLRASSLIKGDLPDLVLRAIDRWEEEI